MTVAIAFDLRVSDTHKAHPKGVSQAYTDSAVTLAEFGFERVQGSVYVSENEDLGKLFAAMNALQALPWLPPSIRDIRAFRIEQWSVFTTVVKSRQ